MASYRNIEDITDLDTRIRIVERLLKLRAQLAEEVPEKTATETLLIATWNIREFGDNRLEESLYYIAEIIDHFDIVVIQEINSKELAGFKSVMKILGDNWSYIISDGVKGTDGGSEAMAFVYNKNKVQFTNLAGEIVLQNSKKLAGAIVDGKVQVDGVLVDGKVQSKVQFARTPFMVSLMANWFSFNICTVHIYYGSEKNEQGIVERRKKEIETISSVLLERQKEEDVSYILLGDFNIPDTEGVYFNALSKKRGFFVPKEIQKHPTDLGQVSHYDQIAFKLKLEDEMVLYSDDEQRAGAFNFTKSVYRDSDEVSDYDIYLKHYLDSYLGELDKENAKLKAKGKAEKEDTVEGRRAFFRGWRTYQMSDHLPLWVELKIDFSDQFLKNRAEEAEEAKKAAVEDPTVSDTK